MSPILVTLMSRCGSDFECSNIRFNENKLGGVDLNSDFLEYCVRKNGGQTRQFSADSLIYIKQEQNFRIPVSFARCCCELCNENSLG